MYISLPPPPNHYHNGLILFWETSTHYPTALTSQWFSLVWVPFWLLPPVTVAITVK